ncbi:SMI1/KNR4 family protein [Micromonospora chersina]|uniref:SMI1/KNR4 family protein n=1 Tax=Micromonospora chersina TaxID=47854 RepID=UPI00368F257E
MTRFDQIKTSFWSDSPHGRQPPLTHQAVRDAEGTLGVKLPAALLDLLWIQNGGVVADEWSAYPTTEPTSWADDHLPFESVMGIGPTEAKLSLLDTPYLVREWDLPAHIVLLAGDGHTWIALDYRTSGPQGEPSVTWFDADMQTELSLAPNFRSFVEGLMRIELPDTF